MYLSLVNACGVGKPAASQTLYLYTTSRALVTGIHTDSIIPGANALISSSILYTP